MTTTPTADLFRPAPRRDPQEVRGTRVPRDAPALSTPAQGRAGPVQAPPTPAPVLAERAAQRRALDAAMQVRCPDRMHWQAQVGVPCTPPDAGHPWGWVCLVRIEHEVTTREERRQAYTERRMREDRRERLERRAARESAARARIAARIHKAAQR